MNAAHEHVATDDRAVERRQLAGIRARLAAVGTREFGMLSDGGEMAIYVSGGDMVAEDGTRVVIARFTPAASPDEWELMARAPADIAFLLSLLDRAARRIREMAGSAPEPAPEPADGRKDFAAEAAMKCGEPGFARFMADCHGLEPPLTPERVAQRLRSVLRVDSRARLNDDADAAGRWKAMRGDFEAWRRTGR